MKNIIHFIIVYLVSKFRNAYAMSVYVQEVGINYIHMYCFEII